MASRSYSNLLDLASGGSPTISREKKRFPRVATVPGVLSELDNEIGNGADSDAPSSVLQERLIIVGNQLPIKAQQNSDGKWNFSWDNNSLLVQLKDGVREDVEVIYIGCLKAEIEPIDQDDVAQRLLENFKCVPAYVPPDLFAKYYHGFCKQSLWPLFHYMLPIVPDYGIKFDRSLWQAYVSVNKIFADKVMEVISPDDDYVWVHDYHLMVLPTFLRKRFNRVKLGYFLHSPFPSSEVFRALPVRIEILRALLNSDLIGFHIFDYARHFLSCCTRMLGLSYQSKRGTLGLEYYGRVVSIKIMAVGIHIGQLQSVLNLPETQSMVAQLRDQFQGRQVMLGVDDMDVFKGISLKLLAMEQLLTQHPNKRGRVVLVQIANPARSRGRNIQCVQSETFAAVKKINDMFGRPGYEPVVLVYKPLKFFERIAYYVIAECCLVTALRDGMNLIPYEYVTCRQSTQMLDEILGLNPSTAKKSMLVVSEFMGCSPSLSGAVRVNPWSIDSVTEAMEYTLTASEAEKQLRHERHYRFVSTHDVAYWARSFLQDLESACADHTRKKCWGIGFGLGFRVIALDPSFRKLSVEHIVSAYKRTKSRAILVDYDGTMVEAGSIDSKPSRQTIETLNSLCRDPKNIVFLVSGEDRTTLTEWFSDCDGLGLAAEHGYFIRPNQEAEWERTISVPNFEWKQIAEPVVREYKRMTDGSGIESRESTLVWDYRFADPDLGPSQAKELMKHLTGLLAKDGVSIKNSRQTVEVRPKGVNKGLVAERLLAAMQERGETVDFVLCIGDDSSDEEMFEVITAGKDGHSLSDAAEIFACTVGQKPTSATFYLDDSFDIPKIFHALASSSNQDSAS
ncbi:PREDICTED: alpha,alpha-trehalose-phosphate synthase [UDP-forming] 5 [Tarenaya hassleriana]|uniref:alpha,alpha-trehalose-phosphate synthase [UDP-forming] 5 n=1 Tax=Tarenaya hassleriana TaxID=28532 RepID=UPI00053C15FF|nr:PREDICTED: alpha,alpha-trehalose-phosphate synthase [UDP-forming] 5 [Tarenaya hassleriana]XP_010518664.1 PREDICTED: alpha,alpha-trehalose-phosphate synthase [UDP-forming] 5 [Tarenaya hassleriana]